MANSVRVVHEAVYALSRRRSPGAYFGGVMEYWKPGDQVVIRDVHRGRIRAAVAMTIVRDNSECTLLYLGRGYPFCLPADSAGRLTKDVDRFDRLIPLRWEAFEQLSIAPAGESHAVILRWTWPDWRFIGWYVNLQAPMARTWFGFDSTDHALDVVISPNRERWHWKDEGQLADLVAVGHFSVADAAAFRVEGERVVGRAKAGLSPFNEPWPDWRPDPAWTLPDLPDSWNRI